MNMARQEKAAWILMTIVLVILFLLSSTDFIIKEKETQIYPVSVIIDDTTDDYYTNFRMGVDKAADECHADISFITLYDKEASGQMELFKREMDDGAGALVLSPLKQQECKISLERMTPGCPLVIIGSMYPDNWMGSCVSQDYRKVGEILGEAIVRENTVDKTVILFSDGLEYGYNRMAYDSLLSVLEDAGFQASLWEKGKKGIAGISDSYEADAFLRDMMEAAHLQNEEVIIAALDIRSLDAAADFIAGNPAYGQALVELYGIGSTTKLLNQMDRGIIKGLVVSNQYDAGYLAITRALEAMEKRGRREQTVLESYYIEKDDLQKSQFEKILYPIE